MLEHPRGVADLREQIDMTKRTCSVPACGRPQSSTGYCGAHYARWKRTGQPGAAAIDAPAAGGACSIDGCRRRHKAKGYCAQHYNRWAACGDPGSVEIRSKGDSRARDGQGRKRCTKCGEWRPVDHFNSASRSADKLGSHCYRCHRAGVLRRTYGVTIEWYEETLAKQGGVCALCLKANADGRLLAVDHDHSCCAGRKSCGGCARALLCTRCNTGLGAFGDDTVVMLAAVEYVRAKERGRRGLAS